MSKKKWPITGIDPEQGETEAEGRRGRGLPRQRAAEAEGRRGRGPPRQS